MGFWDFLVPAELPYPGMPARNGTTQPGRPAGSPGGQPGQANTSGTGLFDKVLVPAELPYPMPVGSGAATLPPSSLTGATLQQAQAMVCVPALAQPAAASPATVSPVPAPVVTTPAAATNAAPSAPEASAPAAAPTSATATAPTAAPSPVTVVIALNGNAPTPAAAEAASPVASAPLAPAPAVAQPSEPVASVPPPVVTPAAPAQPVAEAVTLPAPECVEKRVMAFSRNPRLRARPPKAHEVYIEEVLEEVITTRMLSKEAAPVAFAVPDGCNAVEVTIGPIETDPEHGRADDLDEVVAIGELKVEGIDETGFTTGDQVVVTAPWRHASFVELAADHLRFPIFARFFNKQFTN